MFHCEYQEGDYIEMGDETRARLIKRAHDTSTCLIEMHSHLGDWPAGFSYADRLGLKETVTHMWWRLKKRPYLALVVTNSSFDALVWLDNAHKPHRLDVLLAGTEMRTPTNFSLGGLGMSEARYHRNVMLFGEEGQRKLRQTKVVIAGVGGLGSPVAQHMALLGVEEVGLIDDEELDDTNHNRFIGARADDPVPGSPKVSLAARLIHEINPQVRTRPCESALVASDSFELIKAADWVFGCFDEDGPRFILNEICAAYGKSYVDLASDVPATGEYGGRICVSHDGDGCLHCLGLIDDEDVNGYLRSADERARDHIIVLGEAHLCRILRSYADYYNGVRTHRSLNKDAPIFRPVQRTGSIKPCPILGGLHHHYVRI